MWIKYMLRHIFVITNDVITYIYSYIGISAYLSAFATWGCKMLTASPLAFSIPVGRLLRLLPDDQEYSHQNGEKGVEQSLET